MRILIASLVIVAASVSAVLAGGGPENVAVVVNADSWASQAVANEFIQLRRIPPNNVIYLSLGPTNDFGTVDVNFFREKVLAPCLATIKVRGLDGQIDYVIYSTDLPNTVNFTSDLGGANRGFGSNFPSASATGLTYLYQRVLAKNTEYLNLNANHYARVPSMLPATRPRIRGFRRLMEQQEYNLAETMVQDLLKKNPADAGLLYNHACTLAQLAKPQEALSELSKAVDNGLKDADKTAGDKYLKPIADQEPFKALLERMKKLAATGPSTKTNPDKVVVAPASLGFRGSRAWTVGGDVDPTGKGDRYLLSTMLAWTSGRGNSVSEALDCLRRAASADGTCPKGAIYYVVNEDIRARTRQWGFASAVESLKALDVAAEIFETKGNALPEKKEMAGLMAGSMYFGFTGTGSTFDPGAIAEHLTSFGGVLDEYCDHSPMTEWIRCGAAGTSGTVTEPYALQQKFPMPNMHVYYAEGCSLAEAFYQSLMGPYQLLILGDPLCRPWAKIPEVKVEGLPGDPAQGTLAITPSLKDGMKLLQWELFVDG